MRARGGPGIGLVIVVLTLASESASGAQAAPEVAPPQPTPVFTIPRAKTPIRIDGVLDEEAWKGALRLDLPYEIDPGENTPAPVKTEVLLTYDDAAPRRREPAGHMGIAAPCFVARRQRCDQHRFLLAPRLGLASPMCAAHAITRTGS